MRITVQQLKNIISEAVHSTIKIKKRYNQRINEAVNGLSPSDAVNGSMEQYPHIWDNMEQKVSDGFDFDAALDELTEFVAFEYEFDGDDLDVIRQYISDVFVV